MRDPFIRDKINERSMKNHFEGKRVLITGGLGFIGSNLARKLVELGSHVQLVDSLIPEYGGNYFNVDSIKNQVEINISDVRDEFSMHHLVQKKDYLFNLAGQTSHLDSMKEPSKDLDINCRAQLSILEACRKHNPEIKIVFASTRQIYGKPDYLPVDEKHLLRPVDVNGINKMAGEWYHVLYSKVYNIRACSLRLTNTYGPRMRIKDARQTFLGLWIRKVLENQPFEVWGGEQLRDFTYVEDAVQAMILAAENGKADGQIFNLGGDSVVSLQQLADLILTLKPDGKYEIKSFPEDRKSIDVGDYYGDFSLIRSTLGWQPETSLKEGLSKTLEYYSAHLEQYL
jgi:UDP-glucose 4-epimerase